eukprot:TRINITY_DN10810_c0_g1_i1.p1 TRINITY_DN10810_c0_g1~~TRINITY_DN10810_c0_g1_i1.p1  ORF type:complete len:163 (-),score=13.58 TRINITY_DN10810_c0_g1_i1:155-643(-)
MAQSRLEKIGTIYSKIRGFLGSGAIRPEQIPLWYDVYEAFPPKYEPRWDRPHSTQPAKKILYQEDIVRARFYEVFGRQEVIDLNTTGKLKSQIFIDKYMTLHTEGHPAESLWDLTIQALELEGVKFNAKDKDNFEKAPSEENAKPVKPQLSLKDLFESTTPK